MQWKRRAEWLDREADSLSGIGAKRSAGRGLSGNGPKGSSSSPSPTVPSAGSVDSDGDGDIGGDGNTEAPAAAAAAAGKKSALLLPLPLPLLAVLVPPSVSVGDVCKRRSFSLAEVRIRARAALSADRASSGRTAAVWRSQTFSRGVVCYVCGGTTADADGAAEHEPPCLRRWEADRKQSVRRAAPSTEGAMRGTSSLQAGMPRVGVLRRCASSCMARAAPLPASPPGRTSRGASSAVLAARPAHACAQARECVPPARPEVVTQTAR